MTTHKTGTREHRAQALPSREACEDSEILERRFAWAMSRVGGEGGRARRPVSPLFVLVTILST